MKYIKKYENLENYKANDYVKVVYTGNNKFYHFIKILNDGKDLDTRTYGRTKQYMVEYINFTETKEGSILNGSIMKFNIERKCTPEEAEEYEIKKALLKFNI
jgi:hypothetical protein